MALRTDRLLLAQKGKAALLPHNVDGRSKAGKPAGGLPAIVDMVFTPGPVTVFRTLGAMDDEFLFQGQLMNTPPSRRICGSCGAVTRLSLYGRPVAAADLRDQILARALPHHYTAARGHLFF